MLATGETRLVRIGSRSKSEKLNAYSLHNLARRTSGGQIGDSQHRIRQVTAQLFALKDLIEKAVVRLLSPCKWDEVRVYLSSDEPRQLPFLQVPASRDGYRIVDSAGKIVGDKYLWELWCSGAALPQWLLPHVAIQEEDYPLFQQFWQLPHEERETRARGWKTDMRQGQVTSILHLTKELDALAQELKTLSHDRESTILKQARIIGATTPGAATYRDLLSVVPPKVVIVEEAGEVLEAHILTSLATTCEHLIMIGDHLQLPPKVEQYNLTAASGHGYKLDCSLFERLVKQSWQSVSLQVQHRMRPSISAFVRAQTYPSLKDHDSVLDYPNVTGVMKNVVFVDHRHPEDWDDNNESKTKSNSSEARLVLEIIRFLLLQGYAANRIVVLTPYVGQLIQLVGLIQQDLKEATAAVGERDLADVALLSANDSIVLDDANAKGVAEAVRCSSIDNFQGEESDIIVASLVRSSARGAIGFLKEPQRVNVLLSRARLGLFLVGNSDTLLATRAGRTVWGPVLRRLRENEGIVKGFPTFCQLHPEDDPIILKEPSDFRAFRLNGGCTRACSVRLDCGHPCPLLCHPADRSHTRAQLLCCEPCKRFPPNCQNQHACPKLCKEKCGRCMAFVGSRLLPCDHVSADVRCYEEHELKPEKLIQELSRRCVAKVSFTFPKCRHEASLTCLESRDPELICQSTCQETAQCGHLCKKRYVVFFGAHRSFHRCLFIS